MPRSLASRGQGAIERIRHICRQTQAWTPGKGCFYRSSEGSESQTAPQDERGGAGTHPAGADQAVGRIEGCFQGESDRYCRAAAKGQEKDCKGCLIALSAEYNRFRNQILRSAARKSREGTSIILARYVWECRSTRNCLGDGHILRAVARSGKRAQSRHSGSNL